MPALNLGLVAAAIWIASPVRGLRPTDAALFATLKVPNPTNLTSPPAAKLFEIASKNQSTALAASVFDIPADPATLAISSFLFIIFPLY